MVIVIVTVMVMVMVMHHPVLLPQHLPFVFVLSGLSIPPHLHLASVPPGSQAAVAGAGASAAEAGDSSLCLLPGVAPGSGSGSGGGASKRPRMSASQLHSRQLQAARLHSALVDEYNRWGRGQGAGEGEGRGDGQHREIRYVIHSSLLTILYSALFVAPSPSCSSRIPPPPHPHPPPPFPPHPPLPCFPLHPPSCPAAPAPDPSACCTCQQPGRESRTARRWS